MSCTNWSSAMRAAGRCSPACSPAASANERSFSASTVVNVASKLRFAGLVATTPGTGYQVRSGHESPDETDATLKNVSASRPSWAASCEPSARPSSDTKSMRLFASFAAMPMVGPPTWNTWPAIGSTSSAASATASSSPPSMNVSVPAVAPAMPPETGESTKRKPRAAEVSWQNRDVSTSTVDVSSSSAVLGAVAQTPPAPPSTSRTCSPRGSDVNTASAPATASAMDSTTCTPRPRRLIGTPGRDRPRARRAPREQVALKRKKKKKKKQKIYIYIY
jgi:hypothetical protein